VTQPKVASREEWLVARRRLLAMEKEAAKARDALNAERRALPMVEVDRPYRFHGPKGDVHLPDLFEGRRQLIVYHFMFDPEWERGCHRCTAMVDDFGDLSHLHARDTTLAVVSRAPLDKIEAYRRERGWDVPWYSSHGSDFNYDFHVTMDESVMPVEYNYRSKEAHLQAGMPWFTEGEQPGVSVFLRDGERIFHTYSAYSRGLDKLAFTRNWLDLTPLGRQDP
jgi:predicted dithiol-disulfide oxidoreductase (DUF899 family)